MYNTRYLPENFEQCWLGKTILRHFPYNLKVRSRWIALVQDGAQKLWKGLYDHDFLGLVKKSKMMIYTLKA